MTERQAGPSPGWSRAVVLYVAAVAVGGAAAMALSAMYQQFSIDGTWLATLLILGLLSVILRA